jgi:hypothetical protein
MLSANIPVPEGVHTVETHPERGDRLPQSVEDVRQSFIITVQAMAVVVRQLVLPVPLTSKLTCWSDGVVRRDPSATLVGHTIGAVTRCI